MAANKKKMVHVTAHNNEADLQKPTTGSGLQRLLHQLVLLELHRLRYLKSHGAGETAKASNGGV